MTAAYRKWTWLPAATFLLAGAAMAQTGAIEGDVKGPDGSGLRGALVKIERTDIKGNYKVKTDKKGHYFHAGLPLGTYNVALEVEGKEVDKVQGVKTRLGDPVPVNFDLKAQAARQEAAATAAETGQLTQEQSREMSKEQREALEKAMKERSAAMAKNKALNDAFNAGVEALKTKQYDAAVESLTKASELDPKQMVVWAQLAEAYIGQAGSKTGQEQSDLFAKGIEAYGKAIEIKPDDADFYNNRGLAYAKSKKFDEAQADLEKAASLNPANAGRYFYNLGAILVNTGNIEPAGVAFKKAIDADPNYADAQYQYGVYLLSKAQTTADGKVIPPDGTLAAFQKYIELKPDGPFAESAKGMIATLESSVQTTYENPAAKKGPANKKGKK